MDYSWKYGETTAGLSWGEYVPAERSDKKRFVKRKKEGRAAVTLAMLLTVISSYAAGGIISADDIGGAYDAGASDKTNKYEDSISVMSPGVITDMDMDSVYESERKARISELATAYIEEYMSQKYGESSD